ncbi:MAG: glycosyltransferase family 61 protein [Verrucomicrobia bacterium]|nr:glycosyltransferase family 61 protein [Verrucomicrobiota bacterium]
MANLTIQQTLLGFFRKASFLYRAAKKTKYILKNGLYDLIRKSVTGLKVGPPSGFYSIQTEYLLSRKEIKYKFKKQALPSLPQKSLIRIANMMQNGHQPWPVFSACMGETRLVGKSLAPINIKKKLMIEALYDERKANEDPSYNYLILPKEKHLVGNWTSIIGRWSMGFYHWLLDDLPRLAALTDFPDNTQILVRGPFASYQAQSLKLLGLHDRCRPTKEKNLVVESYFFSSPVGMTGCTNPYAIDWLRKTFLPLSIYNPSLPKKILITRKGKTRGIVNFPELIRALESRGWNSFDLEELSFQDQINLFHNADSIIAEHGAALANLVWVRPGTRVLELCADNFLNGCYEAISLSVGVDHHFEIFKADSMNRFEVPVSKIMMLLRDW